MVKWICMPWKSITSSKEKFTELVAQNVAKIEWLVVDF